MPCLLLVTWRGFQGKDAPEHLVMGDVLPRLLDLFSIPHRAPDATEIDADLDWAAMQMRETRAPVALAIKPGLFDT
jgi:sulfopyruvate decarboxylase TPP-binding subunit